jgi:hypothetical protein
VLAPGQVAQATRQAIHAWHVTWHDCWLQYYGYFVRRGVRRVLSREVAMNEEELWMASRRYLLGEITIEQLEAIERPYTEAFNNALLALSKREISRKRRETLRKIFVRRNKHHERFC